MTAYVDPRDQQIAQLQALVKKLLRRIAELEARLAKNSSNSSRPPSSDIIGAVKKKKDTKRSKMKRGGQIGHARHQRHLVAPEMVSQTVRYTPKECAHCGRNIAAEQCIPQPRRHQIIDLPEIKPHVTEYQCFSAACSHCGKTTTAKLPDDVPREAFSPRLKALVALLTGTYYLSKRNAVSFLADAMGIKISTGSVCKMEQFVSEALAEPYQQVLTQVQTSSRAHADETSWRQGHKRAYLWMASTKESVVFSVSANRGKAQAQELLGREYAGILHTDRWRGYDWVDGNKRQLCWAHLRRNFQALAERGGPGKRFARKMIKSHYELFKQWHDYQDGKITRNIFCKRLEKLRCCVRRRLLRAASSAIEHIANFAKELLRNEASMWTLVYAPDVSPTNNQAERDIRKGVIWRKISFGTDSERGSRFAERMLTASGTAKRQGRNFFTYLTSLCCAWQCQAPSPMLFYGNLLANPA